MHWVSETGHSVSACAHLLYDGFSASSSSYPFPERDRAGFHGAAVNLADGTDASRHSGLQGDATRSHEAGRVDAG